MAKGEGESETDGERVERDLQRKEEEEEGYGLGWVGEGREGRRCASSTSGTAARRWQFRSFLAHWRGAAVATGKFTPTCADDSRDFRARLHYFKVYSLKSARVSRSKLSPLLPSYLTSSPGRRRRGRGAQKSSSAKAVAVAGSR